MRRLTPKLKRLIILCLALALIASVIGGVSACLTAKNAVLSYEGRHIARDVYAYWQVRFSYAYRILYGGGQEDTPAFWRSVADTDTGITHAEACDAYVRKMVGQIVVAATLFDSSGYRLSTAHQEALVSAWQSATGGSRFGGDSEGYERLSKTFGFTKESVRTAMVYEMKANALVQVAQVNDAQLIAYYQNHFVRARLIYVNNYCQYLVDATTGERLQDENGNDRYRLLEEEERLKKTEEAFALIQKAKELDANDALSLTEKYKAFEDLMGEYNEDIGILDYQNGYYLADSAETTAILHEAMPEAVEAILSLDTDGEIACVEGERGYYVVMRYTLDAAALADKQNDDFFSDLVADANQEYVIDWIRSYLGDIVWKKPMSLPIDQERREIYKLIVNIPGV